MTTKDRAIPENLKIIGPAAGYLYTILDIVSVANHLAMHRIRMYQIIPFQSQFLANRPGPERYKIEEAPILTRNLR